MWYTTHAHPRNLFLMRLNGPDALPEFHRSRLLATLAAMGHENLALGAHYVHYVRLTRPLAAREAQVLDRLLAYGPRTDPGAQLALVVIPRPGTVSPWSSKASDIARACGLSAVERIERGVAAPNEDPEILFTVEDLNSHRRMELIADGLANRGHPDDRIEKIIGGNWVRLFGELWRA